MEVNNSITFKFGKYKGRSVFEISKLDFSYLDWCIKQSDFPNKHPTIYNEIIDLKHHHSKIAEIAYNPNCQPNYNIKYGEFINFDEFQIKRVILNLQISTPTLENLLFHIRKTCSNLNYGLYTISDEYFNNPYPLSDIHLLKIFMLWKFGIQPDTCQNSIIDMWNKQMKMPAIIHELTRKRSPEEKVKDRETARIKTRKICKPIPFLFTPALCQFLLTGLDRTDMKAIYKCRYDNIMSSQVYPVIIEKISELYKFDSQAILCGFITNPYAYYRLPSDKCDLVVINTNRQTSDFNNQKLLGSVSRLVYKQVSDLNWVCVPSWLMKAELPFYLEHQSILNIDYGLRFDNDYIYLDHIYHQEIDVSMFISNTITTHVRSDLSNPDNLNIPNNLNNVNNPDNSNNSNNPDIVNNGNNLNNSMLEGTSDFCPTQEQINAIQGVSSVSTSIITGLAGTGKTTVIKEIVKRILKVKQTYIICSFTAKAVQRVRQVLGPYAYRHPDMVDYVKTIHSLISGIYKGSVEIPNYLIIDEATMVSLSLFHKLITAIGKQATNFVMIGDINQLPPLKYGRPFEDIINSGCVPIHELTQNLRVRGNNDDPIIVNSTNIVTSPCFQPYTSDNFHILDGTNIDFCINTIIKDNNINLDNVKNHKFITALNDHNAMLNKLLASKLNQRCDNYDSVFAQNGYHISCLTNQKDSQGNKIVLDLKYTVGDPVIFIKNHIYDRVSNGDEGVIECFTKESNHIVMLVRVEKPRGNFLVRVPLYFDKYIGKMAIYKARYILLAYCITIHKSQGSEWKHVYTYIDGNPSKRFLNKRLTYTGVTRAREQCNIIEKRPGIFTSCARQNIGAYYTGLPTRIKSQLIHNTILNPK